jgi:uncharacterized protein (DUF4415 family)
MRGRSSRKPAGKARRPSRGRADLSRLRRVSDAQIRRTSPAELANLPNDFWEHAEMVAPTPKRAVSLRLDEDVLEWFRRSGPRYQTRMNAVLRMYVSRMRKRA